MGTKWEEHISILTKFSPRINFHSHLYTINKEAVYDVDSCCAVYNREEESEEPAQRNHLEDLQLVLQQGVEIRKMLLCQLLKYNLVCGGREVVRVCEVVVCGGRW